MAAPVTAAEDTVLKLTISPEGEVWYLDGDRLPKRSGFDRDKFLDSPIRRRAERIRVVGMPSNANLIAHLYTLKARDELSGLEVCSPLVCSAAADRTKPEVTLFNMRQWALSPSVGGWHEVTAQDYAIYAMVAQLVAGDLKRAMEFLPEHPVTLAAQFVCCDSVALTKLLGAIVDPRWFVDPDNPDRLSKLFSFLGLDPATERASGRRSAYRERNQLVASCWRSGPEQGSDGKPGPRSYFHRYHRELIEGKEVGWKADLRTAQRFVAFLRQVWVDAIYPMPNPWMEPLFETERFFRRGADAMAFDSHMKAGRYQD